jgi:hypothetical protein
MASACKWHSAFLQCSILKVMGTIDCNCDIIVAFLSGESVRQAWNGRRSGRRSERYVYWNDSSPNWVNDKSREASDVLHVFKETCPPRLTFASA